MKRLTPIEGLRAWLALWVLGSHVFYFSGYTAEETTGLAGILHEGALAVSVFMMVSGFVIFNLLDQRRESYPRFIIRRAARIFPAYVFFFACAVLLSGVVFFPALQPTAYMTGQAKYWHDAVADNWQTAWWNIPLHLSLLQGLVPDAVMGDYARNAFLLPSWSITLEWQFYLIAPVIFMFAVRERKRGTGRVVLLAILTVLIFAGHRFDWGKSFLLYHTEYFIVGAASYFAYRKLHQLLFAADSVFPVTVALVVAFYLVGLRNHALIPLCLWGAFFALLIEPPGSLSSRLLPLFTNPIAQYLGRISFSIYLAHWLVIILVQAALVRWLPNLSRPIHFWVLLLIALPATIAIAALAYRYIESPGMEIGKKLSPRPEPKSRLVLT